MEPATPQQLVEVGADVLRAEMDPDGTGALDLTDGSDNTLLLSVSAAMAARNTSTLAARASARYRSSATGDDLRQIARDVYRTDKKPDNYATVVVYLKRPNTTGGAGSITAGSRFAVVASATQQAVMFAVDADVSVGGSDTKVKLACTCQVSGEIGNVDYSKITRIVDSLFDDSFAIFSPTSPTDDDVLAGLTGPERAAGGAAEETDEVLSNRLSQFPATAARRPGTPDGVKFGILETPGVRYCTLTVPGNGTLRAFVGDAQYGLNQAMRDAIDDNLEHGTYSASGAPGYRAMAIPVSVLPFTLTRVIVTATIYMEREVYRYDQAALLRDAIALGTAYYAGRQHADEHIQNKVEQALLSCHPETQQIALTLSPAATLRAADASYAGATEIVRFYVDEASWQLTFAGPQTL